MTEPGLSTLHTSPFQELFPLSSDVSGYYRDHRALLSRADLEFVAMADGRSLDVAGRY